MKTKKFKPIDPNLLIAIGVLISSFAALFIYMRQASIMNEQTKILLEQTKASTWPHLSIEMHYSTDANDELYSYKYVISNKGTGPAILQKTIISFNHKPIQNWDDFYNTLDVPDRIPFAHSNDNINERVLASNEDLVLIEWSSEQSYGNRKLMQYIKNRADKISIEICYKSIHGDTWTVKRTGFQSDLEINVRSKVKDCGTTDSIIFKE